MPDAARQWGRRALDFVDAVERLNAPGLVKLFESEIKACGFHAYIMAGLPAPGTALPELTLANGWPAEWFELYTRENFSVLDPVPRYALPPSNRSDGLKHVMTRTKTPPRIW